MDKPTERPYPHEAAYYGLGAIAVAGVMLLMAIPAFQLAFWLQLSDYKGFASSDKQLAAFGGYIGVALVLMLCLTGVVTGVRGLGVAQRCGEPKVLNHIGILLNLFAAAVWIGCGLAWHSQAWRFI